MLRTIGVSRLFTASPALRTGLISTTRPAAFCGSILARNVSTRTEKFYRSFPDPVEESKAKETDVEISPFKALIDEMFEEEIASGHLLPNTRGKYREQVCRTPMLKTSTKRLNLIAHLIKGLDVEDAMLQLMFLKRDHCEPVLWAIQEGCKIAREVQRYEPRNFYVAWTYVCRGEYTVKADIKGRGRCGKIRSPEAHMVIMLRDKAAKKEVEEKQRAKRFRIIDRNPIFQSRILNPRIPL